MSVYAPLIEVTRGPIVESLHFGAVAVVDSRGKLIASYGDADLQTFLRSSAKPFQALPFIEMGGDQAYGLTPPEVALICASHSGTDEHVAAVKGIQEKVGVGEADLLCGTHWPYHDPTTRALWSRNEKPTPNRHNCSGKHTGMLAHALLRSLPKEDYIHTGHPVQRSILTAFAGMVGLPEEQVVVGIDGCSAPNFAVPLRNAALGYARLCDPEGLPTRRADACRRIFQAMTSNPQMVGGPGRFDTLIMERTAGRMVVKAGAEGYQAIGLPAGALGPGTPGIGIAFKIADGDGAGRARPCAALEVLRQLEVISAAELDSLADFGARPLYNFRRLQVGEMRSCFQLDRSDRS